MGYIAEKCDGKPIKKKHGFNYFFFISYHKYAEFVPVCLYSLASTKV